MIKIGTDIIELEKIKRYTQKQYFLKKVFTEKEIDYAKIKGDFVAHLATAFAAKESVFKALGIGWIDGKEIEIIRNKEGKPEVRLKGSLKGMVRDKNILLSLSYSDDYAIAFAIIKKEK